jgi:hypothetical protein
MDVVSDGLFALAGYGQWQYRVTPGGVLEVLHIPRPLTPDYVLDGKAANETIELSEETTRNVIKVWGYDPNIFGRVLYTGTRPVPGITHDRIGVYADPNLDTTPKLRAIATAALDQFASISKQGSVEVLNPDPNLKVGSSVLYSIPTSGSSLMDCVTDLRSDLEEQHGYAFNLTVGRRSYRYPYFPVGPPTSGSTVPWEFEEDFGEAFDIVVFGDVFICGTSGSGTTGTWKVQRRDHDTGDLVWSVLIPTNPGLIGSRRIAYGICADVLNVYVCGYEYGSGGFGVNRMSAIRRMSVGDGVVLWANQHADAFGFSFNLYAVSADGANVYTFGHDGSPGANNGGVVYGDSIIDGTNMWTTFFHANPGTFARGILTAGNLFGVGNLFGANQPGNIAELSVGGGVIFNLPDPYPSGGLATDTLSLTSDGFNLFVYGNLGDGTGYLEKLSLFGGNVWNVPTSVLPPNPRDPDSKVGMSLDSTYLYLAANSLIGKFQQTDGAEVERVDLGSSFVLHGVAVDGCNQYICGKKDGNWYVARRVLC